MTLKFNRFIFYCSWGKIMFNIFQTKFFPSINPKSNNRTKLVQSRPIKCIKIFLLIFYINFRNDGEIISEHFRISFYSFLLFGISSWKLCVEWLALLSSWFVKEPKEWCLKYFWAKQRSKNNKRFFTMIFPIKPRHMIVIQNIIEVIII